MEPKRPFRPENCIIYEDLTKTEKTTEDLPENKNKIFKY